jgi:nucleoside 2-deoxyribosyltransferase
MKKAYLAGPDVFFDNATEIARSQKLYCEHHGILGLSPLDNELPNTGSKFETAKAIVEANITLINQCDIVIANLSNFRGTRDFPSCDSGTAWECGYATGLGKPVLAYTRNSTSIPEPLRTSIEYCIIGSFTDALFFISYFNVDSHTPKDIPACENPLRLDPSSNDIHDADAYGSFQLGLEYALGNIVDYTLEDKRSLIEKYGLIDRNGARYEDFDLPANIMISISHRLA